MNHTRSIRYFSLIILPALPACTAPSVRTDSTKSPRNETAEQRAATRAIHAIIAADNAGDLQAALDCYTDDVLWIPPDSPPITGKAAIGPRYEKMYRDFRPELVLSTDELIVSGDLAYVRGTTCGRLVPRAAGKATEVDDDCVMILRRAPNGEWKIARLMWNRRSPRPTPR